MHDVLPEQIPYWQHLEEVIRRLMISYTYEEIRMPLLESLDLFKRTIGLHTDIVEKEMYTITEYGMDMALRPEGTAGCVRACLENNLLRGQTPRLWYMGPMFRHERPQKGRYRQFHQAGVEVFGFEGPDIDTEMICMTSKLWRMLGLEDVELQINSLGSTESRAEYRRKLVEYMTMNIDVLDADSKRRLQSNPLRILDSKNPAMQALIENAPRLYDDLDKESRQHFEALKSMLDALKIKYVINTRLVRGLDYYEKTVFEWVSDRLGAQNAICAGGRFDGLVAQLGGPSTSAAGFAVGLERVIALMQENGYQASASEPDIYLVMVGEAAMREGQLMAENLREELPALSLRINCGGGNFKNQLKRADKSGARLAMILGDEEIASRQVTVKYLRADKPQQTITQSSIKEFLVAALNRPV
jgi:histidyl-tRNA synthetase